MPLEGRYLWGKPLQSMGETPTFYCLLPPIMDMAWIWLNRSAVCRGVGNRAAPARRKTKPAQLRALFRQQVLGWFFVNADRLRGFVFRRDWSGDIFKSPFELAQAFSPGACRFGQHGRPERAQRQNEEENHLLGTGTKHYSYLSGIILNLYPHTWINQHLRQKTTTEAGQQSG